MGEAVAAAGVAIYGWITTYFASAYGVLQLAALAYSAYTLATQKKMSDMDGSGHLSNTKSSDSPLPLIYGTCRVGCNVVYASTSGGLNSYLHLYCALGEGPIDAVEQIYLNGKPIESYPALSYTYTVRLGTSTQSATGVLSDPMRYTAYIYLRLLWDRDGEWWQGIPEVTARVRGLKVYDPDSGTTAWSANPALCVYDMLTRPSTRGGLGLDVYGGPVPSAPRVDTDMVADAADYCDAKGWTCNMPITTDQYFIDNLALVLPLFRGDLVYSETVFKTVFRDTNYESVAMNVDDDDVVRDGDKSSLAVTQPNVWNRPNTLRVKYLDSQGDPNGWGSYQTTDFIKVDAAALAADGDSRENEARLYGFSDLDLVQAMGNYLLERARNTRRISLRLRSRAAALEPNDLLQLTHAFPGWDSKLVRVVSAELRPGPMDVACELIEEDEALYDDDYDAHVPAFYDTTLPGPSDPVPSVRNVALVEQNYFYRDKRYVRLQVDFDPPDDDDYPFFDYAEVYVSVGGSSDYRYVTRSDGDYMLEAVEIAEVYFVKLRAVSIWGSREDYDDAPEYSRTINGYTDAPSDMTGITPAVVNDTVYVKGDPVDDAGIRGYEFRLSGQDNTSWSGATYLSYNRLPVWQLAGMRAGNFRIWCSPQDDQGQYSDTPVFADFAVGVPHGYSLLQSENIDYDDTGDSFTNTEMYDEGGGEYALRCSHGSGVLTGTYTSREMDLGSSQTVRVQADFLAKVINSSLTWAAIWGPTAAWNSKNMDLSWGEIYGIDNPSRITAVLKWGDTSGSLTNEQELFHLMAVTATGRYFQVEISFSDPHDAQYGLLIGPDGDTVLTVDFYS